MTPQKDPSTSGGERPAGLRGDPQVGSSYRQEAGALGAAWTAAWGATALGRSGLPGRLPGQCVK